MTGLLSLPTELLQAVGHDVSLHRFLDNGEQHVHVTMKARSDEETTTSRLCPAKPRHGPIGFLACRHQFDSTTIAHRSLTVTIPSPYKSSYSAVRP